MPAPEPEPGTSEFSLLIDAVASLKAAVVALEDMSQRMEVLVITQALLGYFEMIVHAVIPPPDFKAQLEANLGITLP